MLKLFFGLVLSITLWQCIISSCTPLANATSWSDWENCTVTRVRVRNCTVPNDCGPDNITYMEDVLSNFTTCPQISDEDIQQIQTTRDCNTKVELENIANESKIAIDNIKKQYQTHIATSTGFGYIAILAITLIFSFPLLADTLNLISKCVSKKKIHAKTPRASKMSVNAQNSENSQQFQEVPKYIE